MLKNIKIGPEMAKLEQKEEISIFKNCSRKIRRLLEAKINS
jgi:hypothetical protein